VLREAPAIEVRFVHVFRDSRACVFSWARLKPEATVGDRAAYLPRRALLRTSAVWNARNLIAAGIAGRFPVAAGVRYEAFARAPRRSVTSLAARLGIDGTGSRWVRDNEILEGPGNHLFAGNPDRMERGSIVVRADNQWRRQMAWPHKWAVLAFTFPTLWALGYVGPGARLRIEREQPVRRWRMNP
jgi:hypothetical protein